MLKFKTQINIDRVDSDEAKNDLDCFRKNFVKYHDVDD